MPEELTLLDRVAGIERMLMGYWDADQHVWVDGLLQQAADAKTAALKQAADTKNLIVIAIRIGWAVLGFVFVNFTHSVGLWEVISKALGIL